MLTAQPCTARAYTELSPGRPCVSNQFERFKSDISHGEGERDIARSLGLSDGAHQTDEEAEYKEQTITRKEMLRWKQ